MIRGYMDNLKIKNDSVVKCKNGDTGVIDSDVKWGMELPVFERAEKL